MNVLYKLLIKTNREYSKRAGHSIQMRGEPTLSNCFSDMGKHSGKRKQRYVDHPRDQSKLTCLIHGPGNSSDERKVLNDFSTEYAKGRKF